MGSFILDQARQFVAGALVAGDVAVDATVGNGWDTLFLARQVGPLGRVIGFDVQPSAIDAARARLEAADLADRCILHRQSHAEMATVLATLAMAAPKVVMFNLGYLPGADKTITTQTGSTLRALGEALQVIVPGGLISVVAYRGHPGAAEECDEVESWSERLDQEHFDVTRVVDPSGPGHAPRLFVIRKLAVV